MFQFWTDSVGQPACVSTGIVEGCESMRQDVRSIRKQFRLTPAEEKRMLEFMKEQGMASFSDFLRKNVLETTSVHEKIVSLWFDCWKVQKLEEISRDVHGIFVLAKTEKQVTQEHVGILLTCVQELIAEVSKSTQLSQSFQDKYMK